MIHAGVAWATCWRSLNPSADDQPGEQHHAAGADDPHDLRHNEAVGGKHDRQQQQADEEGGEQIARDRMAELAAHGIEGGEQLGHVARQDGDEGDDGDDADGRADEGEPGRPAVTGLGESPGHRQAGQPHDGTEQADREVIDLRPARRCGFAGGCDSLAHDAASAIAR